MRPNVIDIDVADASLTGILEDATGAGPWAAGDLDATGPTDGLAHQLSVDSGATNLSAITMTFIGTDADGKVQTEDLVLGNGAVVETTKYYASVTNLSVDSTLGANTVDIGWVDEVASQTYPIDRMSPYQANIFVDITGTLNFTVQELWENVYDVDNPQQDATWINITALASKTADTASQATLGASAIRIILNSYSSGAELQMYTNQASSD